jgi:hypothetical protein
LLRVEGTSVNCIELATLFDLFSGSMMRDFPVLGSRFKAPVQYFAAELFKMWELVLIAECPELSKMSSIHSP